MSTPPVMRFGAETRDRTAQEVRTFRADDVQVTIRGPHPPGRAHRDVARTFFEVSRRPGSAASRGGRTGDACALSAHFLRIICARIPMPSPRREDSNRGTSYCVTFRLRPVRAV